MFEPEHALLPQTIAKKKKKTKTLKIVAKFLIENSQPKSMSRKLSKAN